MPRYEVRKVTRGPQKGLFGVFDTRRREFSAVLCHARRDAVEWDVEQMNEAALRRAGELCASEAWHVVEELTSRPRLNATGYCVLCFGKAPTHAHDKCPIALAHAALAVREGRM